jgi:Co/Zn/Cd efflux system component
VRTAIEGEADNKVADLHLWQVGPGNWAAIVSVVTANPCDPSHYRTLLAPVHELSHVTIEVHRCRPEGDAGTLLGAGTVTQA